MRVDSSSPAAHYSSTQAMHHCPLLFLLSILALVSVQGLAARDAKDIEDLKISIAQEASLNANSPTESSTSIQPSTQPSTAKFLKASTRRGSVKYKSKRHKKEGWCIISPEERKQLAQYLIKQHESAATHTSATKLKALSPEKLIAQLDICIHSNDEGSYQEKKILLRNCLYYLQRKAPKEAYAYINSLKLWQHSEHFLERTPYYFLEQLEKDDWVIELGALKKALFKLEKLIPIDINDGITCYAGRPMDKILKLIYLQEGAKLRQQLEIYSKSIDEDLSYSANRLLLRMNNLPKVSIENLIEEQWRINKLKDLEKLSAQQKDIAILLAADLGLRRASFPPWLNIEKIQRAALLLEELELHKHAQTLLSLINSKGEKHTAGDTPSQEEASFTPDNKDAISNASIIYNTLRGKYPANIIARRILQDPSIAKTP